MNLLNQYTNRTVPAYLEVSGTATNTATVLVNGATASRQADYFRQEVSVANSSAALVQWLTSVATNGNGTTTVARLSYVPQTPEAFSYDGDGNLTQDGLWNYSWDAENRLTRIETRTNAITDSAYWQRIDCDYDYMGRRVRKQVYAWNPSTNNYHLSTSLRFFYDGWNLIGQVDEVTGTRLSFLWGTDLSGSLQGAGGVGGLVAMTVHNGALAGTYFYGYDGNGNVAVLVNAADGTEAARYEYGPFGELIRATGPLARWNPLRFSTKYQDDESDLTYYGYRSYNPSTGRWLSRDPAGEDLGEVNLCGFVGNGPIDSVDYLGLMTYSDLEEYTKRMDAAVSYRTCCCANSEPSRPYLWIIGTASGPTVKATAAVVLHGCVDDITYKIFWWDCYSASSEAGPFHNSNDAWKNFGWSPGESGTSVNGSSYSKTAAPGHILGPLGLRDPYHLAMDVAIVYIYCGKDGKKHANITTGNELEWAWNKRTKSWTGPTSTDN